MGRPERQLDWTYRAHQPSHRGTSGALAFAENRHAHLPVRQPRDDRSRKFAPPADWLVDSRRAVLASATRRIADDGERHAPVEGIRWRDRSDATVSQHTGKCVASTPGSTNGPCPVSVVAPSTT